MNKPTYLRAYAEMVDYILQFGTTKIIVDNGREHTIGGIGGTPAFRVLDFESKDLLQPNDLVLVTAANSKKFRLSWFLDSRKMSHTDDHEYLLKSVQDGEECWWSGIGLNLFRRECVSLSWFWNDEQFAFYDRWRQACFDKNDAYLYLPNSPVFDGDLVTLSTRVRFSINEFRPTTSLVNWKTATVETLSVCYQELVALHKKEEISRKEQD